MWHSVCTVTAIKASPFRVYYEIIWHTNSQFQNQMSSFYPYYSFHKNTSCSTLSHGFRHTGCTSCLECTNRSSWFTSQCPIILSVSSLLGIISLLCDRGRGSEQKARPILRSSVSHPFSSLIQLRYLQSWERSDWPCLSPLDTEPCWGWWRAHSRPFDGRGDRATRDTSWAEWRPDTRHLGQRRSDAGPVPTSTRYLCAPGLGNLSGKISRCWFPCITPLCSTPPLCPTGSGLFSLPFASIQAIIA